MTRARPLPPELTSALGRTAPALDALQVDVDVAPARTFVWST